MALRQCSGPKPGNRSPNWACFPPSQQYPDQTAISQQKHTKTKRKMSETWMKSHPSVHGPDEPITPTTCCAVTGSTTRVRTSPAMTTNKVQKTLFTCSFFPNASIAASGSTFIACCKIFGKNTNSGKNRTAAPVNASVISARPARKIPTGTANTPASIEAIPTSPNQK